MICIGIPICRPLYKSFFDRIFGTTSGGRSGRGGGGGGYQKQSGPGFGGSRSADPGAGLGLRTIGGGVIAGRSGGAGGSANKSRGDRDGDDDSDEFVLDREGKTTPGRGPGSSGSGSDAGPFNDANAASSVTVGQVGMDNRSEESILGEGYKREKNGGGGVDLERGEGLGYGGQNGNGHRNSGGKTAGIQVTEEWHVTRE